MAPVLSGLIDYAGLFPPARLSMPEAVAGYARATASPHAEIVDRFLCPASRLDELAAEVDAPWPVVAVVDDATTTEAVARHVAAETMVRIEAVEGAVDVPQMIELLDRIPKRVPAYVELPVAGEEEGPIERAVGALARARATSDADLRAKVRCGGVLASSFPSPRSLGAFVASCRAHGVRFKATAGMHHPFRHVDPSTGFSHHGFVNLLAAVGLARDADVVATVLADTEPRSFALADGDLTWRGIPLADDPRELLVGFGSCSVDEPVADLLDQGWLSP